MEEIDQTTRANTLESNLQRHGAALLHESTTSNSDAMVTLENIEREVQSLVERMVPVSNPDSALRLLLINTEWNTSLIASVFDYYAKYNELFLTIMAGPSTNLTDYLVELDRLTDAIKYFKHLTVVHEVERVIELYNIGRQKLVEESDTLILQYSDPLLPRELLELCGSTVSTSVDMQTILVSDLGLFRIIFTWFKELGFQQGLIDSYATKRGTMIRSSLQLLAEYLRQTSVRRASFSTLTVPPCSSARRSSFSSDTMRDHLKTKLSELGRRLSRSPFAGRSHSSLRNSFLLSPKMAIDNNLLSVDNLSFPGPFSDDRETNNYKFSLDAFIFLLLRDLDLLFYSFAIEYKSLIFTKLIELPLIYMHKEAQHLCTAIKHLSHKLDTGKFAFCGLISIVQWFYKSKTNFSKLHQETDLTSRHQFASTLSTVFECSVVEYLRLVLDEIKNDSSPLSQGGNVHPLTSNVLSFMKGLLTYEDTIITLEDNQNECLFNLSDYFVDLIQSLRVNISKKISMHTLRQDETIRAIFLLNNSNYLLKRLEGSPLLAIIERTEPDLKVELKDDMHKSVKTYTKCYTSLIIAIQQMFDYDKLCRLPDTNLKERDRDQLKKSFSTVNAAIDTLRQQNHEYIIDDIKVRDYLRDKSKKLILNVFKMYHTNFAHKDFTQNPEKYIQYNPSMVELMIEQFFEH